MKTQGKILLKTVLAGLALGAGLSTPVFGEGDGWGLSPRIALLKSDEERQRYGDLFAATDIRWFRTRMSWQYGRNPKYVENLSWFGDRGYLFLALVQQTKLAANAEEKDPFDLTRIYRLAKTLASEAGPEIGAWESFNEPDIGFRKDLPDASSAFMKTWYLGLKASSRKEADWNARQPRSWISDRPVLAPSMSLPPRAVDESCGPQRTF